MPMCALHSRGQVNLLLGGKRKIALMEKWNFYKLYISLGGCSEIIIIICCREETRYTILLLFFPTVGYHSVFIKPLTYHTILYYYYYHTAALMCVSVWEHVRGGGQMYAKTFRDLTGIRRNKDRDLHTTET